ncbi:hypothetical protein HOY82DRAFT_602394 [Tuber indicum]|nr:hypothetical protein HOY82DRAFT_602394 [Tuber indicum]
MPTQGTSSSSGLPPTNTWLFRTHLLNRYHAPLVLDLHLPDFSFTHDVGQVLINVTRGPVGDTGRGSVWSLDGWASDMAYDGILNDLDMANPGIGVSSRPNLGGSIFSLKEAKAVSCRIRFVDDHNEALDVALKMDNTAITYYDPMLLELIRKERETAQSHAPGFEDHRRLLT